MTAEASPAQTPSLSVRGVTGSAAMRPAATTVELRAHLAIVTDADISQAVADGRDLEETQIEDLSSPTPACIGPAMAADETLRMVLLHRVHHLPVVDGERLVGIVDISDLCRVLMPQVAEA